MNEKPRVLFVTGTLVKRGGPYVISRIMEKLHKEGIETKLAACYLQGSSASEAEEWWPEKNIDWITVVTTGDSTMRQIAGIEEVKKYLRIHAHEYTHIILDSWNVFHAWITSGVSHSNVFHLMQSEGPFEAEDPSVVWKAELYNVLATLPASRIVVSRYLAAVQKRRSEASVYYMPLFIDKAFFEAEYFVKDREHLTVVSTSGDFLGREKGLDVLIETLTEWHAHFPRFSLTLVSSREIPEDRLKAPFPITVCSAKDPADSIRILQTADVAVFTSTNEGWGLCNAEAIALGIPTIALYAGGNQDFMLGSNAVLVSNGTGSLLSTLISMQDYATRQMIHMNARESMRHYQIDETVRIFKEILQIKQLGGNSVSVEDENFVKTFGENDNQEDEEDETGRSALD